MGIKLGEQLLTTTPPKLSLGSFPSHKPPPETPGGLTPPLHPMVSVPFLWEEVPGRARATTPSSPSKPKSVRCLELDLPPRLLGEASCSSPTTVLDGPRLGRAWSSKRALSQRFLFEDQAPKNVMVNTSDLGLVGDADGLGLKAQFGSCRLWTSGKGTKWDPVVRKGDFDFSSRDGRGELVNIKVRITRFRKSKKSLYKLSHKSSRLFESFYKSVKQMVIRRHANKNDCK